MWAGAVDAGCMDTVVLMTMYVDISQKLITSSLNTCTKYVELSVEFTSKPYNSVHTLYALYLKFLLLKLSQFLLQMLDVPEPLTWSRTTHTHTHTNTWTTESPSSIKMKELNFYVTVVWHKGFHTTFVCGIWNRCACDGKNCAWAETVGFVGASG